MKKTYIKPEIMFDSFELSTNIAGSCDEKLYTPNNTSCGYVPEGYDKAIFITGISGCEEKHDDGNGDGDYNGLCYHVPTTGYNLFNS